MNTPSVTPRDIAGLDYAGSPGPSPLSADAQAHFESLDSAGTLDPLMPVAEDEPLREPPLATRTAP